LKAKKIKLRTAEIPIRFYKDRKGRVSHHKRIGWFSPWYAGWINLKIMLLYAPNFIFFIPGFSLFIIGVIILLVTALNLINHFRLHFTLLGSTLLTIGYLVIQLGFISKAFSDLNKYYKDRLIAFISKNLTYDRGMILGILLIILGIVFNIFLLYYWYKQHFTLESISTFGIIGITFMLFGFQTIFFTFINEIFKIPRK